MLAAVVYSLPAEEVDNLELVCEAFVSSDGDVVQLKRRLIHVYNVKLQGHKVQGQGQSLGLQGQC